ncbi:MAG: ribonuclease E/G, partial [Candidatus Sulfotelmatobacter sp.]
MNKELFVSSTPHETKVGLVEDDLLAEVYLERENEYTLAGSIYKGRVTRVLPGMQSAFVDIGLERDAFLYVSDFMELEEHDEDVTDVIPANRGVQDLRSQPTSVAESTDSDVQPSSLSDTESQPEHEDVDIAFSQTGVAEGHTSAPPSGEGNAAGESQDRERGGWRGRRRRRGGRRDGRSEGRDRGFDSRPARTTAETASAPPVSRAPEPSRSQQFGPPAGYQPILLPGESISKYRGMTAASSAQPRVDRGEPAEAEAGSSGAEAESVTPVAAVFPEDEPIFANPASSDEISPEHEDRLPFVPDGPAEPAPHLNASTSVSWNRDFRVPEPTVEIIDVTDRQKEGRQNEDREKEDRQRGTRQPQESAPEFAERAEELPEQQIDRSEHSASVRAESNALAFAAPGTLEEETIDEDEADAVRYEGSSDDGYEEFEEETRAASDGSENSRGAISEVRETVAEIHMSSLAESGVPPAESGTAESEEDSEELELEEAQAEAEAMLDAEARGNGAVEARAEVRAPATAGYTQRAPRPRPGYERRGGGRRGGGRRFPRRQSQEVPKISDLLKEGQEILVQIAKEPIGKKGARITSHIALPGRFLVYMPTVNHTGVSRKIASDEERQRLKRIVLSERDNGHGG